MVNCVFAPSALLLVVGKRWSPALVDPILLTGECILEIQQLTRAGTVGQCKTYGAGLVQIILRKDSPINEVVNLAYILQESLVGPYKGGAVNLVPISVNRQPDVLVPVGEGVEGSGDALCHCIQDKHNLRLTPHCLGKAPAKLEACHFCEEQPGSCHKKWASGTWGYFTIRLDIALSIGEDGLEGSKICELSLTLDIGGQPCLVFNILSHDVLCMTFRVIRHGSVVSIRTEPHKVPALPLPGILEARESLTPPHTI